MTIATAAAVGCCKTCVDSSPIGTDRKLFHQIVLMGMYFRRIRPESICMILFVSEISRSVYIHEIVPYVFIHFIFKLKKCHAMFFAELQLMPVGC